MDENEVPKGITVVTKLPPKLGGKARVDWLAIKQDYLLNPQKTRTDLAVQYGTTLTAVSYHCAKEGWAKERSVLYMKVDQRAKDMQVEKLAELKSRHALIGKFMQKTGIEPIKNKKVQVRSAKTAMEFIVEGVRIEREAEGLEKQTPSIVNIMAQQQGVIDKYKQ